MRPCRAFRSFVTSLSLKLAALAEAGKPIRVGVIGAGKFGSMFLSQAPRTKGLHVMGIADLDVSRARDDYVRKCFAEYGLRTDPTGRYAAMYKPYHLIGLGLGLSVASVMLRGEPTGATRDFRGDVVATAKRDLREGERLDGEGGAMVYGKLKPAQASLTAGCLPIGLAHGVVLDRAVASGEAVRWQDADFDPANPAIRFRREME